MEYKGNIWSALVTLLVGVALVFLHNLATNVLVIVLGFTLIAAGVFNIISAFNGSNTVVIESNGKMTKVKPSFLSVVTSFAAIILGLWWVFDPQTNIDIIIRLFGVVGILTAMYQMYNMKVTFKAVQFPSFYYIVAALILICGLVMIVAPQIFESILVMFVGIVLIVYALTMICQSIAIHSYNKKAGKAGEGNRVIEDVTATEVHSNTTGN